jgi:hypothetical protein
MMMMMMMIMFCCYCCPAERELKRRIEAAARNKDVTALEGISREIKGRPGLATVRKSIKKHTKRLQGNDLVPYTYSK